MIHFLRSSSARPVPAEYRSNFVHLYLDIAAFGVLGGSALAFVAVYAARQGANAFQLGLLSAAPAVVNLIFALPAARWLEKRPLGAAVFWASVFHRLFYLLWVPLPILFAPQGQVAVLIGLIFAMSVPGAALTVGFNALFADAVPPDWRSHVAGTRNALFAIASITTTLLCGQVLIRLSFPVNYQIVFGIGFLGAVLSTFHLWFVRPLPEHQVRPRVGRSLGDLARPGLVRMVGDGLRPGVALRILTRSRGRRLLRTEVLQGPFGRILLVLFAVHLAQYLPIPLFVLHWVEGLHLSDPEISLGTALFYVSVLLGSTQLAYLVRRLDHRRVAALGALVMSTYPGLLGLGRGVDLFLIASLAGGLGWSLFNGALSNYILEKVPKDHRPSYLAWYNLVLNAAILLGSLAGPFIAGRLNLPLVLILFAFLRVVTALSILRWG